MRYCIKFFTDSSDIVTLCQTKCGKYFYHIFLKSWFLYIFYGEKVDFYDF